MWTLKVAIDFLLELDIHEEFSLIYAPHPHWPKDLFRLKLLAKSLESAPLFLYYLFSVLYHACSSEPFLHLYFSLSPPPLPFLWIFYIYLKKFLVAQTVSNLPSMQENRGLIPGLGRSPEGRNGNPLQYSSLGNPRTEASGWLQSNTTAKNQLQLSDLTLWISLFCLFLIYGTQIIEWKLH